jgi:nicotinamide phosphoribosyltransferase
MKNIITMTDSYKFGHWAMMPKGTTHNYAYFESRLGASYPVTKFIGLQVLLKKYLEGRVVTQAGIDRAEWLVDNHISPGVFNRDMWEHILNEHNGRLPVEIKAVPEGTVVPINNVMMTVVNTCPQCASLTNYLETLLSQVWYPNAVATTSMMLKGVFTKYLGLTGSDPAGLDFMLHDFGYRGVSSQESAGIGAMAHLSNFMGTDTVAGLEVIMDFYNTSEMPGYSVRATEHSVMTALGEDGEHKVFYRLVEDNPTGILSLVIDSYNHKRFISTYAQLLKEDILARDGNTVFRPDSGPPVETTADCLSRLYSVFGGKVNDMGFKELNSKIKLLWGDGVDSEGIEDILEAMYRHGWATSNIIFGMGGALLQKVDRDTQRNAFKSSCQKRDGEWHDIQKNPLDQTKVSKKGKLALIKTEGGMMTVKAPIQNDILETVFLNGEVVKEYTWNEVKDNGTL